MPTKDYAAIAAARIRKPSSTERKPRFLIYGRNKKGKTRFAATAPNVLVLDPEWGTDRETKIDPDVYPIEQWPDMDEAYQFLRSSKEARDKYEWVAPDGLTRMHNMALRWVMNQAEERDLDRKPNQVGKQDYGRANEMVKAMLFNMHGLPMGIVFTAQERMVEGAESGDEDDDADDASVVYVPDLSRGARGAVNAVVDVIGRLYTVKADMKVRNPETKKIFIRENVLQRRLWLEPHVAYDTGYRSEYNLPPYLTTPTVPRLERLITEGKTKA